MSDPAKANLAYGYNLGSPRNGGWKLAGADEYGEHEFPWSDGGSGFDEDATEVLIHAAGFADIEGEDRGVRYDRWRAAWLSLPVVIERSGHYDVPGWVLLAKESLRTVEWTDVIELDLRDLEHPPNEWFDDLTAAVEALGITPLQVWPRWLIFPSYG